MTPADLADLLRDTAAAVLDEHGLDTAALPDTVAVGGAIYDVDTGLLSPVDLGAS